MRIFLWGIETPKKLVNNHNETVEIFETHEERRQNLTLRGHMKRKGGERNLFEWIDRGTTPTKTMRDHKRSSITENKKKEDIVKKPDCSHPVGTWHRERENLLICTCHKNSINLFKFIIFLMDNGLKFLSKFSHNTVMHG